MPEACLLLDRGTRQSTITLTALSALFVSLLQVRTVDQIVLSLGIEVSMEDFFDKHFLVRNLASLFGIPTERMRVPKIAVQAPWVSISWPSCPVTAT